MQERRDAADLILTATDAELEEALGREKFDELAARGRAAAEMALREVSEARSYLDVRFDYHRPSTAGVGATHARTRLTVKEAAKWIDEHLPDCREKSLALTKLEEAMFWANACIARGQVDCCPLAGTDERPPAEED